MTYLSKKTMVACLLAIATSMNAQNYKVPVLENDEPMATGPFTPDWQSLRTYEVPEWFRDAKFGIWAHWGPQCVEGSGDWMARGLYLEGDWPYRYHREHYGHPSEVGFKDILPLFKAENWTPDCGTVSIRNGTPRTSDHTRTFSMVGQKQPRRQDCPLVSPSMQITPGLGMNLLAVSI